MSSAAATGGAAARRLPLTPCASQRSGGTFPAYQPSGDSVPVRLSPGSVPERPPCGERTVFWPDAEACDAECALPRHHDPENVHEGEILGEWHEDDQLTTLPTD